MKNPFTSIKKWIAQRVYKKPSVSPPLKPTGGRGYQMEKWRCCEHCDKLHECRESFREMVERCANEKDGSVILH